MSSRGFYMNIRRDPKISGTEQPADILACFEGKTRGLVFSVRDAQSRKGCTPTIHGNRFRFG